MYKRSATRLLEETDYGHELARSVEL